MKLKLDDLLAAMEGEGPRGPGRRYSHGLRQQVTAWADGERRRGREWQSIATDLGIDRGTLKRWCTEGPALVPVVVRPTGASEPVTLVAPSGWRIEGLSLAQALDVLGQSAC